MTLALRMRGWLCDSDQRRGRGAILSEFSSKSLSSDTWGGVDASVSRSLESSLMSSASPLLRGLDSTLSRVGIPAAARRVLLGSQGTGLLGSLEELLGILLCRWANVVEKEVRRMNGWSVCCADISPSVAKPMARRMKRGEGDVEGEDAVSNSS